MAGKFLLLCIGLAICFGSIYLRKIASLLLGLFWGAVLGLTISVIRIVSAVGIWMFVLEFDDNLTRVFIICGAVVFCLLSVLLDRICAAINAFVCSFIFIFLTMIQFVNNIRFLLIIAAVIASCVMIAAYLYYNYGFILITSFSGAFLSAVSGFEMSTGTRFWEVVVEYALFEQGKIPWPIYGVTLVLGCCGFYVQQKGLKAARTNDLSGSQDISSVSSERFRVATGIVGNQTRAAGTKAGKAVTPLFKALIEELKSVWTELASDHGRQDLVRSIRKCWICFIPLLVSWMLIPLLYYLLKYVLWPNTLYLIVYWIKIITEAMALGILICFAIVKDTKLSLIYQIIYMVCYILFNAINFPHYYVSDIIVNLFRYFILWAVLYSIAERMKKDIIRSMELAVAAFFISDCILQWIAYHQAYFYLDIYDIVNLAITVGTVWFFFRIYCKGDFFNINDEHSTDNAENAPPVSYDMEKVFIGQQYGVRTESICPGCGRNVEKDDLFCSYCGIKL